MNRDSFFVYEVLRRAFLLGLRIRPILDLLDVQPGEKVLDAGCGFGHLAKYFDQCDYTGVDIDPERIEWAKKNIGETDRRRFRVADISNTGFGSGSFDKVLAYGLLHHLSDEQAGSCLKEFSRVCKGDIVFSDPVYSRFHLVNNLLCRMDRGEYVRDKKGYLDLCGRSLTFRSSRYFYAHNGLAKYFLTAFSSR